MQLPLGCFAQISTDASKSRIRGHSPSILMPLIATDASKRRIGSNSPPMLMPLIATRAGEARKVALRRSTAEKSSVSAQRETSAREREARAAMLRSIAERKKVASVRRLTQEELLAEALVTEQINLRSLGEWGRSSEEPDSFALFSFTVSYC